MKFAFVLLLFLSFQLHAEPLDIASDTPTENSPVNYLLPNEFNPQNFKAVLIGKQGVYLGVGTFRALSAIGMGNFDHGILVDYDIEVVSFNKWNLEIIAKSSSRSEYLSGLFRLNLDMASLALIDSSLSSAEKVFKNQLSKSIAPEKTTPRSLSPQHLIDLRRDFSSSLQWGATIFGSDAIFEKIKRMIFQGKISTGCADLIDGKIAFPSISSQLAQRGLKVSIIDLSNVIAHSVPLPYTAEKKEKWIRLEKNLAMLPSTEDALVLTTDSYTTPKSRTWATWGYSSLRLDALLKAIRNPDIAAAHSDLEIISNSVETNKTLVCESLWRRVLPVSIRARYFY